MPVRTSAPIDHPVTRQLTFATVFRARMSAGTAVLPALLAPGSGVSITFGLAGSPVLLKSITGSHRVPANVPWAVPSDGTWRLITDLSTDVRLIHADPALIVWPLEVQRAMTWQGAAGAALRTAMRSVTPAWVDDQHRLVGDLVAHGPLEQRARGLHVLAPVIDPDAASAFTLLASWAMAQQRPETDLRFTRVVGQINQQITDPGLTTASLAARSRLSRRTLQTLFSDHGGIAAYIRRQRLAIVIRHLLEKPDGLPDLDLVADASGLGSRRTLERAMLKVYGLTPLQARRHILAGGTLTDRGEDLELQAS